MAAPYMMAPQKAERAFLKMLGDAIAADVMSGYPAQRSGQDGDGEEQGRELPCYVVGAKDMPEHPKFTGNVRGQLEVEVMTSADKNPEVEGDDPEANHREHVGLVGDALRVEEGESLMEALTTAGRAIVTDFTCLLCRYKGTTETRADSRKFRTTHVFEVWVSPSNV
jgi:hypothetical protein